MAITKNDIKSILNSRIHPGKTLHVSEIHNLVKDNYPLDKEDWEPHTTSRETHYPKWKEKVQGVLFDMKKKGIITHNVDENEYTF